MKKYTLRIYIENEFSGLVLNEGIDSGLFSLVRSFNGVGKVLAIYDVLTDCRFQFHKGTIKTQISL